MSAHSHQKHSARYAANRGFSSNVLMVMMLFVSAVAVVVWVSMGIVAKERWPIRWLELNGSFNRISAEQFRGSLAPLVNSSFFTVDLKRVHEAAARNSWVASVRTQKRWPDTVIVTIDEHVPVAHWNSGFLVSTHGRFFTAPDADEIQGLPWLYGPEEQAEVVLEYWPRFNLILDSAELEIERLTLDQRGAWSIRLNKGTQLQLGRDQVSERLQRLIRSWPILRSTHDLPPVRVDLRYTNGFAVHWAKDASEFAGNER